MTICRTIDNPQNVRWVFERFKSRYIAREQGTVQRFPAHFFLQCFILKQTIHKTLMQRTNPLIFVISTGNRQFVMPSICFNFDQNAVSYFFFCHKFGQEGYTDIILNQIFYGRNASKFNGMVQNDVIFFRYCSKL